MKRGDGSDPDAPGSVDSARMTDSKKRVISILRRKGPQTKGQLSKLGGLAWATVVKVTKQLVAEGVVTTVGVSASETGDLRSTAELYGLRNDGPLAVGIDVEYNTTRMILTNLAGAILEHSSHRTPHGSTRESLQEFFQHTIGTFLERCEIASRQLAGVGIGVPGIGFPTQSRRENVRIAKELEHELELQLSTTVRIGTNTHAYAVFEKWSNETFESGNFIFVSIRTGVGTGIFYKGHLYTGVNGLAGEIGHMKILPNGAPCRCGGTGCLETLINQYQLLNQYRTHVLLDPDWCLEPDEDCVTAGLADLFSRAKSGEPEAERIVRNTAHYLARALVNSIMVLDITNIILSGNFGAEGDAIIPPMLDEVNQNTLPDVHVDIRQIPFDPEGHTLGAALLVLKAFFVDIASLS